MPVPPCMGCPAQGRRGPLLPPLLLLPHAGRWRVEVGALPYIARGHKLAPLFKLTFRRASLQHPLLAGALGGSVPCSRPPAATPLHAPLLPQPPTAAPMQPPSSIDGQGVMDTPWPPAWRGRWGQIRPSPQTCPQPPVWWWRWGQTQPSPSTLPPAFRVVGAVGPDPTLAPTLPPGLLCGGVVGPGSAPRPNPAPRHPAWRGRRRVTCRAHC